MGRMVCAFAVRKAPKTVFSRQGPYRLWHKSVLGKSWGSSSLIQCLFNSLPARVISWYFYKQFGPRSGLTKCQAWSGSGSKLFDTLIVFEKDNFEKRSADDNKRMKNYPACKKLKKQRKNWMSCLLSFKGEYELNPIHKLIIQQPLRPLLLCSLSARTKWHEKIMCKQNTVAFLYCKVNRTGVLTPSNQSEIGG